MKLKATDYVVESLKLIVSIAMPFSGGLVLYGINAGINNEKWMFYTGVFLLLTSCAVAIANINSIVNKLHSGNPNVIRDGIVRYINVLTLACFSFGSLFGLLFVWNNPITMSKHKQGNNKQNSSSVVISNKGILIPPDHKNKIIVKKSNDGKIKEIIIKP